MTSIRFSPLTSWIFFLFCASACSVPPPEEAFLKEKLIGSYCANGESDYRLILADSTYYSIRRSPGILQTQTKVRESCKGKYDLVFDGTKWDIVFESDPDPDAVLENCQLSYTLWNPKEGFVVGEVEITLKELFDEVPVKKAECDKL